MARPATREPLMYLSQSPGHPARASVQMGGSAVTRHESLVLGSLVLGYIAIDKSMTMIVPGIYMPLSDNPAIC
jgi:hypothetical protein